MLSKPQEKRLQKFLREQQKNYNKRKKYCAKTYSDWKDDEFNMLDDKFIWAYTANPHETPSFCSLNDAIVYYNRESQLYIMDVDLSIYDSADRDSMQRMIDKLTRIEDSFAAWVSDIFAPKRLTNYDFSENFSSSLMANDLITLRYKLGMIIAGIKYYYSQTFLDE